MQLSYDKNQTFVISESNKEIEVTDKHGKKEKIKVIPFKNIKLTGGLFI